jgi:photosystem II stability/assembly factor-like uncharacterized protein
MAQERTAQEVPPYKEDHVDKIQQWYEEFTNPEHEPDIQQRRLAGLAQMRQMDNRPAMKALSSAAWVSAGTSTEGGNVSGRPTCIAFSNSGANPTIYLSETFGGLWKSVDNGLNWVSLSDSWQTLSVGGVAVDPNNPNVIYAGTGVAQGGVTPGDESGIGIYKSTDGGLNWQLLLDSNNKNPAGTLTSGMAVNSGNSNFVYQASNSGVFLSTDAGATWTHVLSLGLTSLVLNPLNPAVLYAAGSNGQMDKSNDSGRTWVPLSGFVAGDLMTLAMSAADTNYVYLSSCPNRSDSYSVLSRSSDCGVTWTTMTNASSSSTVNYLGQQGWYANAIAVDPANVNNVAVGGLDIYTSTNGGKTLTKKTEWTTTSQSSNYTHADIHGLTYHGSTLYAFTDGGIFHSESRGQSWEQDMNKNLGTFLFIGGDAAPDFSYMAAGAQDNGTNLIHAGQTIYGSILGGDGGAVNISQDDGQTIYGFFINSNGGQNLMRSIDAGNSFSGNLLSNSPVQNDPWPGFYYEYDVSETDPNTVAVCGNANLYLTTNGGDDNFPPVTGSLSPSKIVVTGGPKCVAISKTDASYIFVGGTNTMYYSTDEGQTWTRTTSALGASPTSITTDPNDETHVYMTVGGTGSKHFFISTDTGHTWKAPAKNLPSLNCRRIAVDQTGQIFIGNDFGVVRSVDNGVTWYPVADGFPQALVTSMHIRSHYLLATSYGRGMWYVDLNQLPPLQGGVSAPAASSSSSAASIAAIYPNPVSTEYGHSTIQFTVQADAHATLSVYDVLGREEKVLMNEWATQGQHELSLDLAGLHAGQHYVVLTADGASVSKPLTIE